MGLCMCEFLDDIGFIGLNLLVSYVASLDAAKQYGFFF
jgi:hypothetical protein